MIHNSKLIKIDQSSSLIYTQNIQINMKKLTRPVAWHD